MQSGETDFWRVFSYLALKKRDLSAIPFPLCPLLNSMMTFFELINFNLDSFHHLAWLNE